MWSASRYATTSETQTKVHGNIFAGFTDTELWKAQAQGQMTTVKRLAKGNSRILDD